MKSRFFSCRTFAALLSLCALLCSCQPVTPDLGFWAYPRDMGYDGLVSWMPALSGKGASLYIAVDHDQIEQRDPLIADLFRAAAEHGVEMRAWILLDPGDGYYPNQENVEAFSALVEDMIRWAGEDPFPLGWITVDMETSLPLMRELNGHLAEGRYLEALRLLLAQLDRPSFDEALRGYDALIRSCHDRGVKVHAVTFSTLLDDLADGDASLQDALNIPVHPLPSESWDEVDVMVYRTETREISGFPLGTDFVYDYALSAVEAFGDRAAVSLGLVGPDAGHDNYNTPEEMLPDVQAALAAGVRKVNVFSLTGISRLEDGGGWLEWTTVPSKPLPDPPGRALRLLYRLLDDLLP